MFEYWLFVYKSDIVCYHTNCTILQLKRFKYRRYQLSWINLSDKDQTGKISNAWLYVKKTISLWLFILYCNRSFRLLLLAHTNCYLHVPLISIVLVFVLHNWLIIITSFFIQHGWTAFHTGAWFGEVEIVKLIIDKSNHINVRAKVYSIIYNKLKHRLEWMDDHIPISYNTYNL